MAWQSNPNISSTTSSATTLNNWRSNAEFLHDRTPEINWPFAALYLQAVESIDWDDTTWTVIHRHNYLHVSVKLWGTLDPSGLRAYVDNVDSSPTWSTSAISGSGVWYKGVINVSSYDPGDDYDVYIKADFDGTGTILVDFLMEYDSGTFYG